MTIHHCDKCQTKIELSESYQVGQSIGSHVELCVDCFEPYYSLLKFDEIVPERLAVTFEN